MASLKLSVRPAPGTFRGPAHVGLYVKRPASPLVRANNVRARLVRLFNATPTYVNLSASDRIRLRAEFEQLGVTKTQLHKLAKSVLDIRAKGMARSNTANASHRHEIEFWAWLSIVTRRSTQPRPTPRTLVQDKLRTLIGVNWNPWTSAANPRPINRRRSPIR